MRCARLSSRAGFDFHFQLQSQSYFFFPRLNLFFLFCYESIYLSYILFVLLSSRVKPKARGEDAESHCRCSPSTKCALRGRSAAAASGIGASRGASCRSHRVARSKKARQNSRQRQHGYGSCIQKNSRNRTSELSRCRSSCMQPYGAPVRCGALDAPTHAHLRAQPGLRG